MTTRRQILKTLAVTGAVSGALAIPSNAAAKPDPWIEAKAIVARIKRPRIPKRDFPISNFGAVAGGANTKAIADAIAACHAAGGGRVIVPAGEWPTGPIHLKSRVELHLERGATLKFSTDPKDYLPLVLTRFEGVECMNYSPLIYAFEQDDVAVTGEGTIDGQASDAHWWNWKGRSDFGYKDGAPNQTPARKKLFAMGEANAPVAERAFGEGSFLRPSLFEPYRCKRVLIEGVTIRNAPFWEVHPVLCESVTVKGLTIDSAGPNTDGCDPESCKDVLIEDCSFNTGDDCIAIKSGRNGDGRRLHAPTENIVIRNCRMKDGHGGVSIGSEISGGVRNVFVENCRMDSPHLDNAFRLKNNALRGGLLENFHFRNIVVGEVAHAILAIHFDYEEAGNGPYTPVLRNVTLEKVVSGKSEFALDARGLANGVIENITISDCRFDNVAKDNAASFVKKLSFKNVMINGKKAEVPA